MEIIRLSPEVYPHSQAHSIIQLVSLYLYALTISSL